MRRLITSCAPPLILMLMLVWHPAAPSAQQAGPSAADFVSPAYLFDANIFAPLPNTLAYAEHLIGSALHHGARPTIAA